MPQKEAGNNTSIAILIDRMQQIQLPNNLVFNVPDSIKQSYLKYTLILRIILLPSTLE